MSETTTIRFGSCWTRLNMPVEVLSWHTHPRVGETWCRNDQVDLTESSISQLAAESLCLGDLGTSHTLLQGST